MAQNGLIKTRTDNLLTKVYGWMTLGLSITSIVAYYISTNPVLLSLIFKNYGTILIIFLLQVILVAALSAMITRMSYAAAALIFIAYSALTGLTLSTIFLVYTQTSLAITFLITAGVFGCMSAYGYLTKKDLSTWGTFLFMSSIGLCLALLVNLYFQKESVDLVISAIGILIFSLFTAFDVQNIKKLNNVLRAQGQELSKLNILSALQLYLDFINLFLFLLRFTGQKRND